MGALKQAYIGAMCGCGVCVIGDSYTPDQARELARTLEKAADDVENGEFLRVVSVDKGETLLTGPTATQLLVEDEMYGLLPLELDPQ